MQRLKKIPSGGSKIAKYALWYYFITTIIALAVSVVFSLLIIVPFAQPIDKDELIAKFPGFELQTKVEAIGILERSLKIILGVIPENIIKIMADNDLIAVITTGTVIGAIIEDSEEKPSTVIKYAFNFCGNLW